MRSTPTRIELQPGKYTVTMAGPNGITKTTNVQIEAGKKKELPFDMQHINFEELEKEVGKP